MKVYDVSRTHVSYLISEIFRCSNLVLAAPTYNNGLYGPMLNLLEDMKALNLQNRKVSIIENGTWAPQAGKIMAEMISSLKGMELVGEKVTVQIRPEGGAEGSAPETVRGDRRVLEIGRDRRKSRRDRREK